MAGILQLRRDKDAEILRLRTQIEELKSLVVSLRQEQVLSDLQEHAAVVLHRAFCSSNWRTRRLKTRNFAPTKRRRLRVSVLPKTPRSHTFAWIKLRCGPRCARCRCRSHQCSRSKRGPRTGSNAAQAEETGPGPTATAPYLGAQPRPTARHCRYGDGTKGTRTAERCERTPRDSPVGRIGLRTCGATRGSSGTWPDSGTLQRPHDYAKNAS